MRNANARLIAAAPDLLVALEAVRDSEIIANQVWPGHLDDVYEKVIAAIAKARGE